MKRCMLCAKERPDDEVRDGICRACADQVRRDAAGQKRREARAADQALRQHGQEPEAPSRKR